MKTVGIIGGLGPETTSEFYLELIFSSFDRNKIQRSPILIWNVPIECKIEEELITAAKGEERYLPYLIDAAQRLEKGGVDFIVMPCNSMHIFIDDIRSKVNIPVLSILEETAKFLKSRDIFEVGIVATTSTISKKLYEKHLNQVGIKQISPDDFQQAKIGKIINNLVLSRHNNTDRQELIKIIDSFSNKNIRTLILACTDLQLLIPHHESMKIYDTMKILVNATVQELLK
ncbi:MAG TPA: amino acid racemase [Candidatus Limnocylindrales bacterium]|nr:amino acid racemase [Candidatus Limnocylindrales bacterium]